MLMRNPGFLPLSPLHRTAITTRESNYFPSKFSKTLLKNSGPVWHIETNFSSFSKMEKFCPSMALSWSVRVSKLFMHILLGLVQTNCPGLEPALFLNFSVYWKICPSVESHTSMQNPNFRFCPLCPESRQPSECWATFPFKIFQNRFWKICPSVLSNSIMRCFLTAS